MLPHQHYASFRQMRGISTFKVPREAASLNVGIVTGTILRPTLKNIEPAISAMGHRADLPTTRGDEVNLTCESPH